MAKDKFILDVCCGLKAFWFDKDHPNVLFQDIRTREKGFDDFRPNFCIKPDIEMDFRDLKYPDKSFKLVVMDPPHIIAKEPESFRMIKYYGCLNRETWKQDIKKGVQEAMRVLEDYGILIFKWNETSIKRKDLLEAIGIDPLFGHPTGSRNMTHWFCFMKIPGSEDPKDLESTYNRV